jgi:uncharacterized protein
MEKFEWDTLLEKAINGDSDAQVEVGDYFLEGLLNVQNEIIVQKDESEAFKWYSKAAQKQSENGISNLAYCFSEGLGCKKNIAKSIKLYEKAILIGSSTAASNLGTIYRDKGEYEIAFEFYVKATKLDGSLFSFKVGLCYFYGIGVKIDKKQAIKHFKKVSEDKKSLFFPLEINESNFYIGLAYLTGEGLRKSILKAKRYFELANKDKDHNTALEMSFLIGKKS